MKACMPLVSTSVAARVSGVVAAIALWSMTASAPLQAQTSPPGGRLLGVEIFPAEVKSSRSDESPFEPEKSVEADSGSSLRFAWFCFGPVFGNASREIDPNYMPPPAATDGSSELAQAVAPVRYTRVVAKRPDRTTWVGWDGSEISYRVRPERAAAMNSPVHRRDSGSREQTGDAAPAANNTPPGAADSRNLSVAELIAENRREMTRISWERAYRRFPQLEREGAPEREAFDAYLLKKYADPREASAFDNPMWPEAAAAAFVAERDWAGAEADSWDRVRAKVRILNDPGSAYTRRFMDFTANLRADPRHADLFARPDWPERVLELHNEHFGAVPEQFR